MLSLLLAAAAVGLYLLRNKRRWLQVALAVFILTGFLQVSSSFPEEILNIGIVQTNVTLAERLLVFNRDTAMYEAIVSAAAAQKLDAVILPEDSRYLSSSPLHAALQGALSVVDTERIDLEDGAIQQAKVFVDGVIYETDEKQYMVPFGEYMPLLHAWLFSKMGFAEAVETMQSSFGYRGSTPDRPVRYQLDIPPVLFCYESAVPYVLRGRLKGHDLQYVAYVVSHAWFADASGMLKSQLRNMLKIQAVENNVYILQSANQASAAVYTPQGGAYEATRSDQVWALYRVEDIVTGEASLSR
jgi:apolipoprotein N-acyltransferase